MSALWADVFLTRNGAHPNPTNPGFKHDSVHHVRKCRITHKIALENVSSNGLFYSVDTVST